MGTLFFYKGGKNIQWGKDSLLNKWCWENWTATCKRMKLEHFHFLTPFPTFPNTIHKDKLKMDQRPKFKTRNYKTLRGKHRILDDINQSKILYDPPPRVTGIKTKVNKWDLIKLKSFCTAKEIINKMKR